MVNGLVVCDFHGNGNSTSSENPRWVGGGEERRVGLQSLCPVPLPLTPAVDQCVDGFHFRDVKVLHHPRLRDKGKNAISPLSRGFSPSLFLSLRSKEQRRRIIKVSSDFHRWGKNTRRGKKERKKERRKERKNFSIVATRGHERISSLLQAFRS